VRVVEPRVVAQIAATLDSIQLTRALIFGLAYLAIALQRTPGLPLTRPAASLLGAVAMVTIGLLPLEEAYAAVDLDVLVFLFGVMLISAYLEEARFFEWLAERAVERAVSAPQLLGTIVIMAGLLSALFVNDTICLVLTPLLLDVLKPLRLRPVPYLIALATGANTGSVLTIIGNPQNMLIAIRGDFTFLGFLVPMVPVAVGALVINYLVLAVVYRRELREPLVRPPTGPTIDVDWPLARLTLVIFGLALAGWLAGYPLPLVALTAGALTIAAARRDPQPAMARVEWPLLLFFAALFVLMHGLETTGIVDAATEAAGPWLAEPGLARGAAVSGIMIVLSNLVSNVPAVLLWTPVIPALAAPAELWLVVAMSSTFAGNLLLIGSMANLIVAERAAARGHHLGFMEFAKAGIPIALLSVAWGLLWLA
jgi:Na+/H+ antiporter NhaD/arsenite permease-like protein